jgi:hypothetical protein
MPQLHAMGTGADLLLSVGTKVSQAHVTRFWWVPACDLPLALGLCWPLDTSRALWAAGHLRTAAHNQNR